MPTYRGRLAWPFPELVHPSSETWRVIPAEAPHAYCAVTAKVMSVPLSMNPIHRFVRTHELVHSVITPPNMHLVMKANPLCAQFLPNIEEMRVNETVLRFTDIRMTSEVTGWYSPPPLAKLSNRISILNWCIGTWGRPKEHIEGLAVANNMGFKECGDIVKKVYRELYTGLAPRAVPRFQRVYEVACWLGQEFKDNSLAEKAIEAMKKDPLSAFDDNQPTPQEIRDATSDVSGNPLNSSPKENDNETHPDNDGTSPTPDSMVHPNNDSPETSSLPSEDAPGDQEDEARDAPTETPKKPFDIKEALGLSNKPTTPSPRDLNAVQDKIKDLILQASIQGSEQVLTSDPYRPEGVMTDDYTWVKPTLYKPRLTKPAVETRLGRKRKTCHEEGVVPNRMSRDCIDGAIFQVERKGRHCAILFDISGSMGLTMEQIQAFLNVAPASTIACYSGRTGRASLGIIAHKGKKMDDKAFKNLPRYGANYCDYPALKWLAKQRGPRIWISDGGVYGNGTSSRGGGIPGHSAGVECLLICIQRNITQYVTPQKALAAMKAKVVEADRNKFDIAGIYGTEYHQFDLDPPEIWKYDERALPFMDESYI